MAIGNCRQGVEFETDFSYESQPQNPELAYNPMKVSLKILKSHIIL